MTIRATLSGAFASSGGGGEEGRIPTARPDARSAVCMSQEEYNKFRLIKSRSSVRSRNCHLRVSSYLSCPQEYDLGERLESIPAKIPVRRSQRRRADAHRAVGEAGLQISG